jgi:ATP-dependent Clp endopeptidase proteolytic subunit ClpP
MKFSNRKQSDDYEDDVPRFDTVKILHDHVYFYGDVTPKSAMELNMALQYLSMEVSRGMLSSMHEVQPPQPIWLHINSNGGYLSDGFSISDTIERIKTMVPVITIVEGGAYSAASLISTSGSKRLMRSKALMLIHQLHGGMVGTYEEMKDNLATSTMLMKIMKEHYLQNSKLKPEKLEEFMKKDIYIDAKMALKLGLIDQII